MLHSGGSHQSLSCSWASPPQKGQPNSASVGFGSVMGASPKPRDRSTHRESMQKPTQRTSPITAHDDQALSNSRRAARPRSTQRGCFSCLFLQFVGPKGADAFADRWLWGAALQYLFLNEHALKVRRYIKQAHITLWRFHPPLAVLGVHAVVEQVRYRVARLDPRCFGGGGQLELDVRC